MIVGRLVVVGGLMVKEKPAPLLFTCLFMIEE